MKMNFNKKLIKEEMKDYNKDILKIFKDSGLTKLDMFGEISWSVLKIFCFFAFSYFLVMKVIIQKSDWVYLPNTNVFSYNIINLIACIFMLLPLHNWEDELMKKHHYKTFKIEKILFIFMVFYVNFSFNLFNDPTVVLNNHIIIWHTLLSMFSFGYGFFVFTKYVMYNGIYDLFNTEMLEEYNLKLKDIYSLRTGLGWVNAKKLPKDENVINIKNNLVKADIFTENELKDFIKIFVKDNKNKEKSFKDFDYNEKNLIISGMLTKKRMEKLEEVKNNTNLSI